MMQITPTQSFRGLLRAIVLCCWALSIDWWQDRQRYRREALARRELLVKVSSTLAELDQLDREPLATQRVRRRRFDEARSPLFVGALLLAAMVLAIDIGDGWWFFETAWSATRGLVMAALGAGAAP